MGVGRPENTKRESVRWVGCDAQYVIRAAANGDHSLLQTVCAPEKVLVARIGREQYIGAWRQNFCADISDAVAQRDHAKDGIICKEGQIARWIGGGRRKRKDSRSEQDGVSGGGRIQGGNERVRRTRADDSQCAVGKNEIVVRVRDAQGPLPY